MKRDKLLLEEMIRLEALKLAVQSVDTLIEERPVIIDTLRRADKFKEYIKGTFEPPQARVKKENVQ